MEVRDVDVNRDWYSEDPQLRTATPIVLATCDLPTPTRTTAPYD